MVVEAPFLGHVQLSLGTVIMSYLGQLCTFPTNHRSLALPRNNHCTVVKFPFRLTLDVTIVALGQKTRSVGKMSLPLLWLRFQLVYYFGQIAGCVSTLR